MSVDTLEDTTGTDTDADGSADVDGDDTGQDTGTPSDSSSSPDSGTGDKGGDDSSDDSGGKPDGSDSQSEKFRGLAELDKLSSRSDFQMNETEKKRVRLAGQHGFTTDEEIDGFLSKQSDKDTGQAKSDTDDSDADDSDADDSGKPDKGKAQSDDGKGVDSLLLKAIAPHLDKSAETVDDAVKAIKNLQHEVSTRGEFVNKAKELGINTADELAASMDMMKNIDADISKRLKDPQGLKGMYDAFKIPVPAWLGDLSKGSGDGKGGDDSQPPAVPEELQTYMDKIEDDGYIGAGDFKKLIPSLIAHLNTSLEKKYEDMSKGFKEVGGYVTKLMKSTQQQNRIASSFADARQISDNFGKFDESLILKSDPKTIWTQSVNSDGKQKSKVHPEFDTLKKVLTLRQKAIQYAVNLSKKTGKTVMPDVMGYLAKAFVTAGGIDDIKDDASKKASQKLVANLMKKLQPPVGKGKGSPNEGFKVPKTMKDVENMSRKERQIFLKKLKTGKLKATVEGM
jgi:hypothetical protein